MRPIPARLAGAYRECRRITRRHSTSYSWAAQLLPADRRPHVYALYAFARVADDIVDRPAADPVRALADFRRRFTGAIDGRPASTPVIAAAAATATTFAIPHEAFERFFRSMEMDLVVGRYETWDDLLVYMDGSAAVIGEMLLPILDPVDPVDAVAPARALGLAFQLTNFLRDVGDDLDRGRQYLPQVDLRHFGVDLADRSVTPAFRDLMRFQVERCRSLYRDAEPGIALLPPRSARCITAALALYERILDEIDADAVFERRATVSTARKLVLISASLVRH